MAVQLLTHLLAEVKRVYGSSIAIHAGHRLTRIDLAKQSVTYASETGLKAVNYDLLVGADGVHSPVRQAMTQQVCFVQSSHSCIPRLQLSTAASRAAFCMLKMHCFEQVQVKACSCKLQAQSTFAPFKPCVLPSPTS